MKYIYGLAIVALLAAGFFAGKGCNRPVVTRHDSTVVIRARIDTVRVPVTIARYVTIRGAVRTDTVVRGGTYVLGAGVTFDTTVQRTHVAGSVDCLTGLTNLFIDARDTVLAPVILHDTIINSLTEYAVQDSKSTLSLQAFAESDVLHGFSLSNIEFGATGNLFLGPLSFYVQPYYDISNGLAMNAGLSITLWEK